MHRIRRGRTGFCIRRVRNDRLREPRHPISREWFGLRPGDLRIPLCGCREIGFADQMGSLCGLWSIVIVTSTPSCGRTKRWRDLWPDLRGAQAYGVERLMPVIKTGMKSVAIAGLRSSPGGGGDASGHRRRRLGSSRRVQCRARTFRRSRDIGAGAIRSEKRLSSSRIQAIFTSAGASLGECRVE